MVKGVIDEVVKGVIDEVVKDNEVADVIHFTANSAMIITPIATKIHEGERMINEKKKGPIDYLEQMKRGENNCQMMWDDTRYNLSRYGEMFGFYKYKMCVEIHKILKVSPPTNRLPSWSTNVGQGTRNVIYLSPMIKRIPWDEWISMDGAKRCMGTANVNKGLDKIRAYANTL